SPTTELSFCQENLDAFSLLEEAIEQYILRDGRYQLLVKSNSGQIESLVMTDFMIPIRAIFDSAENLNALHNITIAL
ncbi:MAG: hypothetical protein F6J93_39450, partial [Oscillatoria sp. SIO1A7]|nr:hypothetical protein [Oscillatoria sp. SIO1A7]